MEDTKRAAKAASKSDQPQQTRARDESGGTPKAGSKAKMKRICHCIQRAASCVPALLRPICAIPELAGRCCRWCDCEC